MPVPKIKTHFTYAVTEQDTQMDMLIRPTGATAEALPDDFSVSVGYSKDYEPAQILATVAKTIFKNLPEEDIVKLGGHGTYGVEFADQDSDECYAFLTEPEAS